MCRYLFFTVHITEYTKDSIYFITWTFLDSYYF